MKKRRKLKPGAVPTIFHRLSTAEKKSLRKRTAGACPMVGGEGSSSKRRRGAVEKREKREKRERCEIVHELLETSEPAAESVETPVEIPIEPAQDPSPKFQSISVQTCPSKRNVRTQVVPKRSCKEVQVDIKPTFQDAGVQCDLQFSEYAPLTVDARVQCDIECPLFASTPRIDCYPTSESEFSDAPYSVDRTYQPSKGIQSSLSSDETPDSTDHPYTRKGQTVYLVFESAFLLLFFIMYLLSQERYDIVFPKYKKGGYIVRKVVQHPTYGYIDEIIKETVTLSSKGGPTPHFTEPTSRPKYLSSGYVKPEKVSAIVRHKSRFI